ncbi:alpha/beta fold hydrolase [Alkalihalobacillus sp. AL-G]|uniref:alpha/beta fold hydrolase n=1 Tax=Alkalihalobacillus sp. AL-G TaxID=2926399 RepID=UPI00272CF7FF|nr:alpha/beta hydrolase [Alkalihalobacillus sp. AL-G]WLD94313.1 alpha/beta hydrolase [Alkalihalobacillus sp. AL-G]
MANWQTQMIDTNRGSFEVFIKGEGTPVCVTHHYSEFNSSGDYFADSFTDNHKVYLVNLREAGNSEKAHESYQLSMFEAVLDLEAIRDALGYSTWTFAGHSTGGMIGVLYGIHFSASLDSLIIVGSAAREFASSSAKCIYNREHPEYQNMQDLIEELKDPKLTKDERGELSKERTKLSLHNPEQYDVYFSKPTHKKMSAVRMNFFVREALIFDVTRQLKKITADTLIICGEHDVQCPIEFSQEMHRLIPNSELVVFDQSNHYPFLEQRKLFQRVVHEYLTIN